MRLERWGSILSLSTAARAGRSGSSLDSAFDGSAFDKIGSLEINQNDI
jgi:hypothetical protein